jgi:hypothetical protein
MTSSAWISLKDVVWVTFIGLICVTALALSYLLHRGMRIESSIA